MRSFTSGKDVDVGKVSIALDCPSAFLSSTISRALERKLIRLSHHQVIPRSILERAAGFAIFTVVKAGFVFSARAGSGVVIARTRDGV